MFPVLPFYRSTVGLTDDGLSCRFKEDRSEFLCTPLSSRRSMVVVFLVLVTVVVVVTVAGREVVAGAAGAAAVRGR